MNLEEFAQLAREIYSEVAILIAQRLPELNEERIKLLTGYLLLERLSPESIDDYSDYGLTCKLEAVEAAMRVRSDRAA